MLCCRPLACLVLAALLAGCGTKDKPSAEPPGPSGASDSTDSNAPPEASEAENKAEAVKRLKRIGKGFHDAHDALNKFPVWFFTNAGTPGLSWRVALLPYLGKDGLDLYKQFKLDEPWDSPANKPLLEKMPTVFASPGKKTPAGKTHLRAFVGETAFLPPPSQPKDGKEPNANRLPGGGVRGRSMVDFHDGTSNTLTVVEAADPVEWTNPVDLPYPGPVTNPPPLPKLGGVFPGGFHGLLGDGWVVFVPTDLPEADLRSLITINGNERHSPAEMKVLYPPDGVPRVRKKGGK